MEYYVFSNAEELHKLAKNKRFDKLYEAIQKSTLQRCEDYHGVKMSAKEIYRYICYALAKNNDKEMLNKISAVAFPLFVEKWDVDALMLIQKEPATYGVLTPEAKACLNEYNSYREICIKEYDSRVKRKHDIVPDFELDEPVRIEHKSGRLSFFKNGIEYVVYYSEDI